MLGRDGKSMATKINDDAEKIITSINEQINIQVEQVQQTFISIQQGFVSLVQSDVDALKVVVKANKAAIKCWKDNKDAIQTFAKSARKQVLSIVTTSINTLSSQNLKLSNQVSSAGVRIQGEALKKCRLVPYCTIKHVSSVALIFQHFLLKIHCFISSSWTIFRQSMMSSTATATLPLIR